MMTWVITAMFLISILFGLLNGRMEGVSAAAIGGGIDAVQLSITLLGGMCLWSGVMRVAEKSGLTEGFSRMLSPVTKRLFRGIDPKGRAMQAISMNIAANMLGLGNAATPLGILAVKELSSELKTTGAPAHQMILFVVLNTASITLIPTTMATLRLEHGAASPMDILPCVWLSSIASVVCALGATLLIGRLTGDRKKEKRSV
ncbi:MAG: nucleoside recognition domain-containing protein [Acetanaerobacterium sp.]